MDFKCIVCNKDIKPLDYNIKDNIPPLQDMYNGGTVEQIHCGYGSLLDGNKHIIAICDSCLDKKTLEGIAIYNGDYMDPKMDSIGYVPLKEDHGN